MAAKSICKLLASLALACCVSACSDAASPSANMASDLNGRFPLSAKPKEAVLVLDNMTEQRITHEPSLSARIGAFTYDFVNRSSSVMQVLVGTGNAGEAQAREVAREAVRVLVRHGVPASRMEVKLVSGSSSLKPGSVVMRYSQWAAVAPECPGWGSNVTIDYSSSNTPNLGCAIQRNIAAMVADPRDLAQPAPLDLRDGMPAEAVMRKFRAGEETKTFEWVKADEE